MHYGGVSEAERPGASTIASSASVRTSNPIATRYLVELWLHSVGDHLRHSVVLAELDVNEWIGADVLNANCVRHQQLDNSCPQLFDVRHLERRPRAATTTTRMREVSARVHLAAGSASVADVSCERQTATSRTTARSVTLLRQTLQLQQSPKSDPPSNRTAVFSEDCASPPTAAGAPSLGGGAKVPNGVVPA